MTVRGANYPRQPNDYYATPPEVVDALLARVKLGPVICDPACGKHRNIIKAARRHGLEASGFDLASGRDFLKMKAVSGDLLANPPYDSPGGRGGRLALQFIEHALMLTKPYRGRVAMLLPIDFDSGKTRRHVFQHPAFALKLVLLDRIKWFDGQSGSTNHCWCVWDWKHKGPPVIKYARIES